MHTHTLSLRTLLYSVTLASALQAASPAEQPLVEYQRQVIALVAGLAGKAPLQKSAEVFEALRRSFNHDAVIAAAQFTDTQNSHNLRILRAIFSPSNAVALTTEELNTIFPPQAQLSKVARIRGATPAEYQLIRAVRYIAGLTPGNQRAGTRSRGTIEFTTDAGTPTSISPDANNAPAGVNEHCIALASLGRLGSYQTNFTRKLAQAACSHTICRHQKKRAFAQAYNITNENNLEPRFAQECAQQ